MSAPGSFLDELRWRGLLYQRTAEEALDAHLAGGPRVGYCGFDPTADSLTVGNLIAVQLLVHWQRCGHRPVVLMGGGTGLIGDPSGKDAERPLLSRDEIAANVASQRRIFERLLDFEGPRAARIVDNAEWLSELRYLDVLRDVGKHFSVNAMIQKESVRERLHQRSQGISYTEFSYMLLQAYDFLHLHRELDCTVQVAGSDQYGNITAGIDLIHHARGSRAEAYGLTAPLLTHADGRKVGKSEGAPVWLTAERTSPYAFFQYWINVPDEDAATFLRSFTVLDAEAVAAIEAEHARDPAARAAQRALARHMTERLHGPTERDRAEAASEALFGRGELSDLDAATLAEVFADVPHSSHDPDALAGDGLALVEVLPRTGLAGSKREAREFLRNGAVSVNGRRADPGTRLTRDDLLPGATILLRRGKKQWHATRWNGEPGKDAGSESPRGAPGASPGS